MEFGRLMGRARMLHEIRSKTLIGRSGLLRFELEARLEAQGTGPSPICSLLL